MGYCMPTNVGGATSQLGQPSLMPFFRSWLWSTVTINSPLGYYSKLLQVVDNPQDLILLAK